MPPTAALLLVTRTETDNRDGHDPAHRRAVNSQAMEETGGKDWHEP